MLNIRQKRRWFLFGYYKHTVKYRSLTCYIFGKYVPYKHNQSHTCEEKEDKYKSKTDLLRQEFYCVHFIQYSKLYFISLFSQIWP